MGPTCKHVVALIGNVLKQVRLLSFAGWISCTNMDWLRWNHRAVKKRHDMVSHGRPHSKRESSLEQDTASCTMALRVKESTKCRTHRNGKPAEKGASTRQAAEKRWGEKAAITHWLCWLERWPVATLRKEDQEHRNQVQQGQTTVHFQKVQVWTLVFHTQYLRSLMLRICERASSAGQWRHLHHLHQGREFWVDLPTLSTKARIAFRSPGLQVIWFGALWLLFWRGRRDCQFHKGYHHLYIGPQSLDIWLLFQMQVWPTPLQWMVTGLLWAGRFDLLIEYWSTS